VRDDKSTGAEPVACPICRRPLKSAGDQWLAAFECERCGEFPDFRRAFDETSARGLRTRAARPRRKTGPDPIGA
jgi:tRNA(Ile2) C34 agmatinyltransferase TiaS